MAAAGVPEDQLDDAPTPARGLSVQGDELAASDSSPAISSGGLAWEPVSENSKSMMPAELAESLSKSGAVSAVSARPANAPPGERLDDWSDSLVGWIPEESRISAIPTESEGGSKTGLITVAVIAALVVGGVGITAAVMLTGGDEPSPVAASPVKAEEPPAREPELAVVADPRSPEPPGLDAQADLVLDEEDLVLEGDEELEVEPETAPVAKAKKKSSTRSVRDVGEKASGPVVQLSASLVRREIAQNMFHVHRCYDDALKRDPTLEGRYSVTITIGTNGRVSQAVIERDTLRHSGVADCVRRKLKDWRFPLKGHLSEPTDVSFPVTFKR